MSTLFLTAFLLQATPEPWTELHARLGWRRWDAAEGVTRMAGDGDLVGPELGSDLELDFSLQLEPGGNSGVKYRLGGDSRRGPEFQVLDDLAFPELPASQRTSALYDVLDALGDPVGTSLLRGRVVARGPHLYHELNGAPAARGTFGSDAWVTAVENSKFGDIAENFGAPARGNFLLQDHGSNVHVGHFRYRDLDALPGQRVELFDGKTLAGWQLVGDASYTPTSDGILGQITTGKRNAFLTTERTFGDFVLEVDVKLEDAGNSGIQIRSAIDGQRLVGMQIEIDPSERSWSGGLYDESRRGWLQNLETNKAGRAAFDREGWNRFRIECVGPWVRTWIDDVPIVDRLDGLDLEGHIGLQVHSGTNTKVRWRGLVLQNLGRHRWSVAPEHSWLDGTTREPVGDGGWRLRLQQPEGAFELRLRDADGAESVLARVDPSQVAAVGGHELELDVLSYGRRRVVTWQGRTIVETHLAAPLNGRLVLDGATVVATEVLAAD